MNKLCLVFKYFSQNEIVGKSAVFALENMRFGHGVITLSASK
jgi:hypothetical protein